MVIGLGGLASVATTGGSGIASSLGSVWFTESAGNEIGRVVIS